MDKSEREIEKQLKILRTSNDLLKLRQTIENIGEIGAGNPKAIKGLANILSTSKNVSILWRAAESLGKIGAGNPKAIEGLVNILSTSKDALILRQAAESLEKIDPGNPKAIEGLVNILSTSKKDYILRQAAESLEKIGAGNPKAIEGLVKILSNSKKDYILRQAAESLEKIGAGNPKAIEMTQTPTNTHKKLLSPTLHFYHYILRSSINNPLSNIRENRQKFEDNLNKIASHLTSKSGQNAAEFLKLIDLEKESSNRTIFDFADVPDECRKIDSDRIYLETGIIKSRLAARLLNDTYFLRLTRYISSALREQSIESFANLSEYLDGLKIELGHTAILAGILQSQLSPHEKRKMASSCLSKYLSHLSQSEIEELLSKEYRFLDSSFYILSRESISEKFTNSYQLKTKNLACVFFYKDEGAERRANRVYSVFQDLLLSYHKINYFYFQSRNIKVKLQQLYKAIEQETENHQKQKWNTNSLIKLPQESLEYYRILSFLQDQVRLIEIQQYNYKLYIRQIEQDTEDTIPEFFTDFQQDIIFYLEQMKADISFLSPAIQLYERLMLSVQTQVSINESVIQDNQAKLGQILTVAGTTIAFAQIAQQPITTTISQHLDKGKSLQSPSLQSLWISVGITIFISLLIGYLISLVFYQLFAKK